MRNLNSDMHLKKQIHFNSLCLQFPKRIGQIIREILPRVSANRRSNNWALESNVVSIILDTLTKTSTSYYAFNLLNPIWKNSRRFEIAPPPPSYLNERRRKIEPNKGAAHFAREENHDMNLLRRVSVTIPLEGR